MSENYCLEKLEQLICDENKIVTYKMLSRELKIHVNKAKKYLLSFLERNKSDKFKAYYFLAGFVNKNEKGIKTIKVSVVSEDALEQTKKDFIELTSCHIYSVNKGKLLAKDEVELYLADVSCSEGTEKNKYSAIIHPDIKIKCPVINSKHVAKTEEKGCLPKRKEVTSIQNGGLCFERQKESEKEQAKISCAEKKGSETAKKSVEKKSPNSEEQNKKKGSLASLWQKKEGNSDSSKKESSKVEVKEKQNQTKIAKNSILSMFSKQAEKNNTNADRKVLPSKSDIRENSCTSPSAFESKAQHEPKVDVTKEVKKSSKPVKRKSNTKQSNHSSKLKSENLSDDEFQSVKKKRRRICTIEDSDSDSECEEEQDKVQRSLCTEDPLEIPPALSDDNEEPIPPTPPVVIQKGKAKVWKTVKKTFQDEDGFFVTKMQKELVSASEESDEDPLKEKAGKKVKKESPKKSLFLTNRKQASLTSFFKQK